jgi:hypothetical protein
MHGRGGILSLDTDAQRRGRASSQPTEVTVKASIRLVSLLAGLLLSLSTGCAAGTSAGSAVPRPVREPLVLADESTARPAVSLAAPLEHRPERARVMPVRRVNVSR